MMDFPSMPCTASQYPDASRKPSIGLHPIFLRLVEGMMPSANNDFMKFDFQYIMIFREAES